MKILLATTNPHKLDEIRKVLSNRVIRLASLADMDLRIPEPIEDQDTFEGNAVLKATHYASATRTLCLADDSGLEVDALGGEPGVRSARYSGADGQRSDVDLANNRKLLEQLGDRSPQQRGARFVCAMALVAPSLISDPWRHLVRFVIAPSADCHLLALVRGTVTGRILTHDECEDPTQPERGRGENGFGYDPLFFVPDLGKTTAQLAPQHKNRISHRGRAACLMWDKIRPMLVA